MSNRRRIGVLLAAGCGRRMGRTKQLVDWPTADGPQPLVAAAYDAICGICDEMVVVLGHEADAVAAALGDRPFHRTASDAHGPMFESIRAGLAAARSIDSHATIVLQPADHPEVAATTLTVLTDHALQRSAQAILPEHDGRGGHPVLIPSTISARLLEADCQTGLADYWAAHPELVVRVQVNDASILRDVDTPRDLAR